MNKNMSKLEITCTYKDTLNLDELTEFQGNLKLRSESDVRKIISSIKKHGFSFPFFVWKEDGNNFCLDGHGRLLALRKMKENGCEIPPLPVVYIDCKSEKNAKDLLLRLNSQYGRMTKQSVLDFIGNGCQLNLDEYEIPAFSIDFKSMFGDTSDVYNQQIAERDYVPPTTYAPKPVANEMPLSINNEVTTSTEDISYPTSLDKNDIEQKDFIVKLTFTDADILKKFVSEEMNLLKEKYKCTVSVSGGLL